MDAEWQTLMDWLDGLREATTEELGRCTDNDYALIFDRSGVSWCTETLGNGEQVKRINHRIVEYMLGW